MLLNSLLLLLIYITIHALGQTEHRSLSARLLPVGIPHAAPSVRPSVRPSKSAVSRPQINLSFFPYDSWRQRRRRCSRQARVRTGRDRRLRSVYGL